MEPGRPPTRRRVLVVECRRDRPSWPEPSVMTKTVGCDMASHPVRLSSWPGCATTSAARPKVAPVGWCAVRNMGPPGRRDSLRCSRPRRGSRNTHTKALNPLVSSSYGKETAQTPLICKPSRRFSGGGGGAGLWLFGGGRRLHIRDDDGEFSSHLSSGKARVKGGGRAAHDLLELLGQLTRHHDLGLTEHLPDRLERGERAMGRLVAHDGHLEIAERFEPVPALPRLHGQEAGEDEAVGGNARGRERGNDRGGSGHRHHGNPRGPRFPHEQETGIGDAGRARIRDEGHGLALVQGLDDGRTLGELVVLEVARDGHVYAEMGEEGTRAARVLAGHQPNFLEYSKGTDRDVFEIADGRSDHVQRARRHGRPAPPVPSSLAGGERETVRENSRTVWARAERFS